jgi:membrane fusion protein, multidrug efflux system
MNTRSWIGSSLLLLAVLGTALGLAAWKRASIRESDAAAASQPEPMEVVTAATAVKREHVRTSTAIGTVLALRSITLRNEIAGTVHEVSLEPGAIVAEGDVLVALDVSVEEAELRALEAQAALAKTSLGRMQRASQNRGASEMDVDRANAELAVADANIERTKAIIARKTIRAPFPARVGMADVHPGQFLNEGTELTTLQGIDEAVHVDFTVGQQVAAGLHEGDQVDVVVSSDRPPVTAKIVAIDARVDRTTRNAMVRARIEGVEHMPTPGASVRVRVPVGEVSTVVAVPVSALRKGPQGDHVFVIAADAEGKTRAHVRLVQSGAMVGDEILILDGLTAGEQVAASGSFKLREGVLIGIATETEPTEAAAAPH